MALSSNQIADLKDAFSEFDTNKDGFINITELKDTLVRLGNEPTENEVQRMMHEVDTDGDGMINFPEFLVWMSKHPNLDQTDAMDEFHQLFQVFDHNGDGFITDDEMKNAIQKQYGETVPDGEIEEMITEADSDADGKVNYEEFIAIMKKKHLDTS